LTRKEVNKIGQGFQKYFNLYTGAAGTKNRSLPGDSTILEIGESIENQNTEMAAK